MHNYKNIYYFINQLNKSELKAINKKIILIYRNYNSNYNEHTIKEIRDYCKKHKRKLFIANDLKMALKLKLDGLYIPSFNRSLNYKNFSNHKSFSIIGSAHNLTELLIKENQGCKKIFISPIFKTNKYKNNLGICKFNTICLNSNQEIIALGGVNSLNIKKLFMTKSVGFAAISWIKKNGLKKI